MPSAASGGTNATQSHDIPQQRRYIPPDAPLEKAIAMHRTLGIERGVIVHPLLYGRDYSIMLNALARMDGSYRGIAVVDHVLSDPELAALHKASVRGVRFHFRRAVGETPALDMFDNVVSQISAVGWHVVLHLEGEDLIEHEARFRALPIPFVIDHIGQTDFSKGLDQRPFQVMLEFMREGNCWVKLANADRLSQEGPPRYSDAIPFLRKLIEVAPNRVIWATDWPHVFYKSVHNITEKLPDAADLLNLLYDCAGDATTLRKILVDNPQVLYQFDS